MRKGMFGLLAASLLPLFALAAEWTDSRGITWVYDLVDQITYEDHIYSGGVSIRGVADKSKLTGNLVIPDVIDGSPVVEIAGGYSGYDFANCGITSISFPSGLVVLRGAFSQCDSLTMVELPDSLRCLYLCFNFCDNLSNVKLNEGLEVLHNGFDYCTKLTQLDLPESLKDLGRESFEGTPLPKNKVGAFTLVDGWAIAWDGSDAPNVVVPKECKGISARLFAEHNENGTITFQEGSQRVSPEAFADSYGKNGGWTEIIFPSTLKWLGNRAFHGSHYLTRVVIPSGDLGDYLFGQSYAYSYPNMTSLELGEGVTSIGEGAFEAVQPWHNPALSLVFLSC